LPFSLLDFQDGNHSDMYISYYANYDFNVNREYTHQVALVD